MATKSLMIDFENADGLDQDFFCEVAVTGKK
jgi:hypothetical protein